MFLTQNNTTVLKEIVQAFRFPRLVEVKTVNSEIEARECKQQRDDLIRQRVFQTIKAGISSQ